jgi:hypothetical protein
MTEPLNSATAPEDFSPNQYKVEGQTWEDEDNFNFNAISINRIINKEENMEVGDQRVQRIET